VSAPTETQGVPILPILRLDVPTVVRRAIWDHEAYRAAALMDMLREFTSRVMSGEVYWR
jgi:hypothetical protein